MGWFKKNKGEFVDLTKLRDQGILRRSQDIASKEDSVNLNGEDIVDLSSNMDGVSNAGDFLSNLAGVGSSNDKESSSVVENLRVARQGSVLGSELKIKLEDIEYKLERFMERLDKLEEKFGE